MPYLSEFSRFLFHPRLPLCRVPPRYPGSSDFPSTFVHASISCRPDVPEIFFLIFFFTESATSWIIWLFRRKVDFRRRDPVVPNDDVESASRWPHDASERSKFTPSYGPRSIKRSSQKKVNERTARSALKTTTRVKARTTRFLKNISAIKEVIKINCSTLGDDGHSGFCPMLRPTDSSGFACFFIRRDCILCRPTA